MASNIRLDGPRADDERRHWIGISASTDCQRLTAVLLTSIGRGTRLRAEVTSALTSDLQPETSALLRRLTGAGPESNDPCTMEMIPFARARLAEEEATAVQELLQHASVADSAVWAVGVGAPGIWSLDSHEPGGYLPLCDAARLAEQTGLNVINGFPARDMALGGLGGPVNPLPYWILLRSAEEDWILLDLGRTSRMTYLPRDCGPASAADVLSLDAGPGMSLLDLLTRRLTNGGQSFDAGGRLAVQGRRISRLVDHWLSNDYFQRPLPRWEPRGVRPEPFLDDSLRMALEHGWSVRDLLCSATHFVADTIALAFGRMPSSRAGINEMLLTGGGQSNGMLLREIASRLPQMKITRLEQRGTNTDTLDAASAAVLAVLHLDQVPANLPAVTGAEVGRVLGQLTPGSPRTWQRLLERLGGRRLAVRPLRSAL
jgi:anhydro-N-acetylmuramic acid kinase